MHYVFLGANNTIVFIIVADLLDLQVEALILVLQRFKQAIHLTIADIIKIPPRICTHKFNLNRYVCIALRINII